MINFDILTIFPEAFESYFASSMLQKAQENKKIEISINNLRNYANDKHKTTDDAAYGGISGMVMKVEPIYRAVEVLKKKKRTNNRKVILLSAKGSVLTQKKVEELGEVKHIILIAGHYKGVDERVAEYIADEELSIGEYILTGGELPAMVLVDAVSRMVEGVLGDEISKEGESYSQDIKYEHPIYTRPEIFSPKKDVEWKVPQVLLSGNHKKIDEWRRKASTGI